jgi:hypothetical protein
MKFKGDDSMNLRNLAAAVVATSLTAVPAFAQAVERAAAPVADASQMGGSSTLLLVLAVVLMGAGIYFLVDNNSNTPDSP